MNVREQFETQLSRFEFLERQLLDPEIQAHSGKMAAVAREHGSLAKLANKYRRFKDLNRQIAETGKMAEGADLELRELAELELPELKGERERLWIELLDMTIGGEDANRSRCVMEIRAGTGGDEAALFCRDLYEMYRHYCEAEGWKVEILELSPAELGGFKEVILGLEGEGVYRKLQYESGGHRVQRVPETEAKGRVHTSLATVAVMAEPEEVEIEIKPEDLRIDLFSASGPGGQHVNKTQSAVRLTHFPSGLVVSCQDEKSQHKNKAKAMRVLKTRLYEHIRSQEHAKRSQERKSLVGSGDRSQKIRTYNYPDNRVTDHRIHFTLHKLDSIVAGNLGPVIDALIEYDRQQLRGSMDETE